MATKRLCDPLAWSDASSVHDHAAIYERLPHRHEMALLDGILEYDEDERLVIGYHDAQPDHFWVRGHIPGRPLMPGVLIVEAAAQICSWMTTFFMEQSPDKFFGFAGVDEVRFRGQVKPGDRLIVAARVSRMRRSFASYDSQAFVGNEMVFEGRILGAMI